MIRNVNTILAFVCLIVFVFIVWLTYDIGYREGQKDYMQGKIKYKKVETNITKWEYIEKDEENNNAK